MGPAVLLSTGRAFGAPGRLEGAGGNYGSNGSGKPGGMVASPPPLAGGPLVIDLDGDGKAEVVTPGFTGDKMPSNLAVLIGRINPKGVHTW